MRYKVKVIGNIFVFRIDLNTGATHKNCIDAVILQCSAYQGSQIFNAYFLPVYLHNGFPALLGRVRFL